MELVDIIQLDTEFADFIHWLLTKKSLANIRSWDIIQHWPIFKQFWAAGAGGMGGNSGDNIRAITGPEMVDEHLGILILSIADNGDFADWVQGKIECA